MSIPLFVCIASLIAFFTTGPIVLAAELNPAVAGYVAARVAEFDQIDSDRKKELAQLAGYIREQRAEGGPVRLTFVCTHNSRRSHLASIWAGVAAIHYGVDKLESYSGGTESTAFNPRAVEALRRAGFVIPAPEEVANPHYEVSFASATPPVECFSKVYDQEPNPTEGFCAVMVCSHADENCPNVAGAEERLAIPYVDPKVADDTREEEMTYDERCEQIAREMLYAFSLVGE